MTEGWVGPLTGLTCWQCGAGPIDISLSTCPNCDRDLAEGLSQQRDREASDLTWPATTDLKQQVRYLLKALELEEGLDLIYPIVATDPDFTTVDGHSLSDLFARFGGNAVQLAQNRDVRVRQSLVSLGPLLPEPAQLILARDADMRVRVGLIREGCLTRAGAAILAQDADGDVIEALESSPWGLPGRIAMQRGGWSLNAAARHPDTPRWAIRALVTEHYGHPFVRDVQELPWRRNTPKDLYTDALKNRATWGDFFIGLVLRDVRRDVPTTFDWVEAERERRRIAGCLQESGCMEQALQLIDRVFAEDSERTQMLVAKHPLVDVSQLHRLSRHPSPKVRAIAAARPNVDVEDLLRLAQDSDSVTVRRTLGNPSIPAWVIDERLARAKALEARAIAANPALSADNAVLLSARGDANVYKALARNTGLDGPTMNSLVLTAPDEALPAFMTSRNLGEVGLDHLVKKVSELDRRYLDVLAEHPSLSSEQLQVLAQMGSQPAKSRLLLRGELCEADVLVLAHRSEDPYVRAMAATELLVGDSSLVSKLEISEIGWALESAPPLSPVPFLCRLSAHQRITLAQSTGHLACLCELAQDPDRRVREEAGSSLSCSFGLRILGLKLTRLRAEVVEYRTGINWLGEMQELNAAGEVPAGKQEEKGSRTTHAGEGRGTIESSQIDLPPANWYPDPLGLKRLRYWDGMAWTDHVAD